MKRNFEYSDIKGGCFIADLVPYFQKYSVDYCDVESNNEVQEILGGTYVADCDIDYMDSEGSFFCVYFDSKPQGRRFIDRLNRFLKEME